jgi:hypothetical protein
MTCQSSLGLTLTEAVSAVSVRVFVRHPRPWTQMIRQNKVMTISLFQSALDLVLNDLDYVRELDLKGEHVSGRHPTLMMNEDIHRSRGHQRGQRLYSSGPGRTSGYPP